MAEVNSNNISPLKYMIQLDGLRAVAIGMVMFGHWFPSKYRIIIPWPSLGVQLFFVLSGFLITGILLKCREPETENNKYFTRIKIFYIRRFLRILPAFYALLILSSLFDFIPLFDFPVKETFFWHISYLSNIYIFLEGHSCAEITHFWSLSVEEQFYLFWPWFIIFLSFIRLKKSILIVIIAAPVFRMVSSLFGFSQLDVLPISSSDALGYGALLAYLKWSSNNEEQKNLEKRIKWLAVIGLFGYAVVRVLDLKGFNYPDVAFGNTFRVLFLGWAVFTASSESKSPMGLILKHNIMVYIGKISYGIYLYHIFIASIYFRYISFSDIQIPGYINIPVLFFLTVLVSSFSWFFFEKPINNLKRFFSYTN